MAKNIVSHNHLRESFYTMPQLASQIMTHQQWQETALATDGQILAGGRTWVLVCQHRGGGMYNITTKPRKY